MSQAGEELTEARVGGDLWWEGHGQGEVVAREQLR